MIQAQGRIIAIGGAEDRKADGALEVLRHVVNPNASEARFVIITSACDDNGNEEFEPIYGPAFKRLGVEPVFMHIRTRKEAENPEHVEILKQAQGVLFSGGAQKRLHRTLVDTPVYATILDRLENDAEFTYAGTSAGAMSMSRTMIQGPRVDSDDPDQVDIGPGFGLMDMVIDTHFSNRSRLKRLENAAVAGDGLRMGIDEDTAVIFQGNKWEIVGSGSVTLIDKAAGQNKVLIAAPSVQP